MRSLEAAEYYCGAGLEASVRAAAEQRIVLEQENTLSVVTGTLYLIADVRSWLLHGTKSEKGW